MAHSDYGEDARVLLNGVTCTVSILLKTGQLNLLADVSRGTWISWFPIFFIHLYHNKTFEDNWRGFLVGLISFLSPTNSVKAPKH